MTSKLVEVALPFVIIVLIIVFAVEWYLREGRNEVLENLLAHSELGPPTTFRGSLEVEEHQPGFFLRLSKSTRAARVLQFQYRWLVGMGRQAIFDEVTFDGPRRVVQFKRKNKVTEAAFSDFSTIRMREIAGKSLVSLWHVELISLKSKATPFVTSGTGDRKTTFEDTAPLAKAVSTIMAVPVQVFVAGNVWTPGWPPKNPIASS